MQTLRKNSNKRLFIEQYNSISRGSLSQFDYDHWITNTLFEGTYFEKFLLSFNELGTAFDYKLTDLFTNSKEKVIEAMMKAQSELLV